jgi:hypothetical protein
MYVARQIFNHAMAVTAGRPEPRYIHTWAHCIGFGEHALTLITVYKL